MNERASHDTDFHAWAIQNARLLREGAFTELDVEKIAEELEAMGASERRELLNRLQVLLVHLLKHQYHPERRGKSWLLTINHQRTVTGKGLAFFSARARCGQWLLSSITTGDHHGHDHPRATQPRRL
ncbi:DUF29 domain-containing protein, partial [Thiococcus pfennigii]|uniref:DUF29 domain-containing protein n=1 Tax=Thiococcus pfennigii TaxID=1057 RepID=UPI001F5B5A1E